MEAPRFLKALASQYRRGPDEPPHTAGLPYIGVAMDYGKDAGALLTKLRAEQGDTFSVFLAGDRVTFVTDPRDYGKVLACRDLDFHDLAGQISVAAFGHGTDTMQALSDAGVEGLDIRLLRGPALDETTRAAQRALEDILLDGDPPAVDGFYDFVAEVIFRATGRSVFGEGFDGHVSRADFEALDAKFPLLIAGLPASLLGVSDARKRLRAGMLHERTSIAPVTRERLAMFAEHGASEADIGGYQLGFLWATVANTVPAAFWSLWLAARDGRALEVLSDEVREVLADAPVDPTTGRPLLGRDSFGRMLYLESAIDEAMRLTSGSLTIRAAMKEVTLDLEGGPLRIRQGERVGLYPWLTHHDPEVYDDPESYRFDRYVHEGKRKKKFFRRGAKVAHYLMPFGGGVSMCPGRHFAKNEILIFAALLLEHFDLEAEPVERPPFLPGRAGLGILPPAHDVPVTVRRRS